VSNNSEKRLEGETMSKIHPADAPRPEPMPSKSYDIGAPVELLKTLLRDNLDRYVLALELERERGLVFPETSVILRDSIKLLGLIQGKGSADQGGDGISDDELDRALDGIE
jgi:hypothetical protein